jgi:hypothetical protein
MGFLTEVLPAVVFDEIPRCKQWGIIDNFTNFAASSGKCTQRDSISAPDLSACFY